MNSMNTPLNPQIISDEEFREMVRLKREIDGYPQSVAPEHQERFTELMVKSLMGKGDKPLKMQNAIN